MSDLIASSSARVFVERVPEGQNALVLGELCRHAGRVVHVVENEIYADRLLRNFSFFVPEVEAAIFPAWDCLPYDRVSPNRQAMCRRMALLQRLKQDDIPNQFLIIATVNAIVQRVPPPKALSSRPRLRPQEEVSLDRLGQYLQVHGYLRTAVVREPGEYAIRGGLIDIFPPTRPYPVRIELLGNTIQTMRLFDPITQRTFEPCDEIALLPASELSFDRESIETFCRRYETERADPLSEAVKSGRRYPGMEHWLPCFYSDMATVFEYFRNSSCLSLESPQIETRIEERFKMVETCYQERVREGSLRFLPPDRLYPPNWDRGRRRDLLIILTPFRSVGHNGPVYDGGGRSYTTDKSSRLFDALRHDKKNLLACYSHGSRDRLLTLLRENGFLTVVQSKSWAEVVAYPPGTIFLALLALESGFENDDCVVLTEHDLFGRHLARLETSRRPADVRLELNEWLEGDFLVHRNYGIGLYEGLTRIEGHEYLCVTYQDQAKVYVPVEEANLLSLYSRQDVSAALDRLGSGQWQKRKARVKKRLQEIAQELIRRHAVRSLQTAPTFSLPENYELFCARFPYSETPDQKQAIEKVAQALSQETPMDVLVCGDAGFGKTEVALRAAFIVALSGYQVMLIAPTTLLARQHYQTFLRRFADFPLVIGQISGLVKTASIRQGISHGTVDIAIGTQALLSKGIRFKRLGLAIVDEEQHFGVRQKETLKSFDNPVHLLTLSATPIPRTLQMSLSGIRDMWTIATPPVNRLMVHTFVLAFDPMVVREALLRERQRGGQSFYVCPRIEQLESVEETLKGLVPRLTIVQVHGQMPRSLLEQRMIDFDEGKYDILLSTNIIESGLDLPRVNTLIVHRANLFGLSQLYQLRGRVGRSQARGYAYFTYQEPVNDRVIQRLSVIQKFDGLGAGLQIAMRDLEHRGEGNLLGVEQSGYIREVGVELFHLMLEEEVKRLRTARPGSEEEWIPEIDLGAALWIPSEYIPDVHTRLTLYRRMAELTDQGMIDEFRIELIDRFGAIPREVENLLETIQLKRLCWQAGVKKIRTTPESFILTFAQESVDPERLLDYLRRDPSHVRLSLDHRLFYTPKNGTKRERFSKIYRLLEALRPEQERR